MENELLMKILEQLDVLRGEVADMRGSIAKLGTAQAELVAAVDKLAADQSEMLAGEDDLDGRIAMMIKSIGEVKALASFTNKSVIKIEVMETRRIELALEEIAMKVAQHNGHEKRLQALEIDQYRHSLDIAILKETTS